MKFSPILLTVLGATVVSTVESAHEAHLRGFQKNGVNENLKERQMKKKNKAQDSGSSPQNLAATKNNNNKAKNNKGKQHPPMPLWAQDQLNKAGGTGGTSTTISGRADDLSPMCSGNQPSYNPVAKQAIQYDGTKMAIPQQSQCKTSSVCSSCCCMPSYSGASEGYCIDTTLYNKSVQNNCLQSVSQEAPVVLGPTGGSTTTTTTTVISTTPVITNYAPATTLTNRGPSGHFEGAGGVNKFYDPSNTGGGKNKAKTKNAGSGSGGKNKAKTNKNKAKQQNKAKGNKNNQQPIPAINYAYNPGINRVGGGTACGAGECFSRHYNKCIVPSELDPIVVQNMVEMNDCV